MELIRVEKSEFAEIYAAMVEAFPLAERRPRAAAEALFSEPCYTLFHTVEDGVRVGFVSVWALDGTTFVEHFVTYPAYRGRGYGRLVLALLGEKYGSLVLEVEPPDTEMAARRIAFYRRAGFVTNDYPYIQPSYHGAGGEVPLLLMSFPDALTAPAETARLLYQEVYRVPFGN